MSRSGLTWAAAGLLLVAAGCTMCAHPYDCCGPVYVDGGANCCPAWRMNSILGQGGGGSHEAMLPDDAMPAGTPTRAANQPGVNTAPMAAAEAQPPVTMRRVPVQTAPPVQAPPY